MEKVVSLGCQLRGHQEYLRFAYKLPVRGQLPIALQLSLSETSSRLVLKF